MIMDNVIEIPDEAIPFILAQRKGITIAPKDAKDFYNECLDRDFNQIKPHLPTACLSTLDIGCGIGGIDILLYRHYNESIIMCLLDGNRDPTSVEYGFSEKQHIYNSLDVTEKLLIENGVSSGDLIILEADKNNTIEVSNDFDLIISLFSWGFHYPISTYIEEVIKLIHKHSYLIIDIRKGTDGLNTLAKYFEKTVIIDEGYKHYRVVISKPKLKGQKND